ncbi:hydroxyacid dehydrogenase [Kribbella jejuensis]|uniref:Phosphoglycerate dehydrogenase-like enzyme n=1 Tax=Kribbella jejuensis TaxID=236068 RepID=A0A542EB36_9ACTN|nr:hydroxyacid dehydrogenase [Kribbella jejuensis]TQJ12529.1 phosphoglycerate dehydrogenase-like enzyme [Kribbella jejuensis]
MPKPETTEGRGPRLRTLVAMPAETWSEVFTPAAHERLEGVGELLGMSAGAASRGNDARGGQMPRLRSSFGEVADELAAAEVLLTGWGCPRITGDVLDAAPKLRAIVHAAGTVKTFVDPVVFERGVEVSSAAAANAIPVAEFTVAAVVLAAKRAFRHRDWYRGSGFKRPLPGAPILGTLGTTVGVLGASRIGRQVIERLRSLDVDVLVSDPYLSRAQAVALGARWCALPELFAASDIVTVHAPLLPETRGLVTAELLAAMPDGGVLVNTARGPVVDHVALEQECVSGRLDAVLDVTDPEPLPPDSPMLRLPNVFITPHLAGAMGNESTRLGDAAVAELERLATGHPLAHGIHRDDLGRIA